MLLEQKIEVQRQRKAQLISEYEAYKQSEIDRFKTNTNIIFLKVATFKEWKEFIAK